MPIIIVQTDADSGADLRTLSERVIADNLESRHYVGQLIERIAWAVADATTLEADTEPKRAPLRSVSVPGPSSERFPRLAERLA